MLLRFTFFALGLIGAAALSSPVTPSFAADSCPAMASLDPDKDGTIDLAEAQKGGTSVFAKLETDHDKTIDAKEAGDRVSKEDFAAADPDKDGTLDAAEYAALVAKRFKAADPDSEGTIDCKELATPAGKALLLLIQ
jgi:hypothetical protein